ncbi:ribonuclease catalytic domain-containing protein [Sutterella sp.]|uniref:ribonuclease catalytic domain-containing protein n=1 Tax=Sutterella sp. TaxID=1981025 RepID=UPI0026E101CE|nr:ribonuclease catalytic domain-containing protein [Sutterella sp.]MDO5532321.1 RNB domain-containing ribonuclease [Sutterella sp.]
MQIVFEEDGVPKVGTVLETGWKDFRVELPGGRRIKVKKPQVIFTHEGPGAGQLQEEAAAVAREMDPAFLWEAAPEHAFLYSHLAREYFTKPGPVELVAILLALEGNPDWFVHSGPGKYRRVEKAVIERRLAEERAAEERRQSIEVTAQRILAGDVPESIAADPLGSGRAGLDYRGLWRAAELSGVSVGRLMLDLGLVASPWVLHTGRFFRKHFPQGREFGELPEPPAFGDLPLADVAAFSIDNSETTEIDDAASVRFLGDGRLVIGIHIAAPGLIIERGSPVDLAARERMSTVYAPGLKTTMLPEDWIKAASLDEGRAVPCVSLYATVEAGTMTVLATETRLERVMIETNLRHDRFDPPVTVEMIEEGRLAIPHAREIEVLWRFARMRETVREEYRGYPERLDLLWKWEPMLEGEGEAAHVSFRRDERSDPVNRLVAELMIFVNETWGRFLDERGYTGIYRSLTDGFVRMSSQPGPHLRMGVGCYAWMSSPLRRYVDLVNQRQLIRALRGEPPDHGNNDIELFLIISRFVSRSGVLIGFEGRMKRYWSLRWIEQEGLTDLTAVVVKDNVVSFDDLPLRERIPGLPRLRRGTRVRLKVVGLDYVGLTLSAKLLEVLPEVAEVIDDEEADDARATVRVVPPPGMEVPEVPQEPAEESLEEVSDASE